MPNMNKVNIRYETKGLRFEHREADHLPVAVVRGDAHVVFFRFSTMLIYFSGLETIKDTHILYKVFGRDRL